MDNTLYIGVDNGVTGTIGVICRDYITFTKVPVFTHKKHTKVEKYIKRLDYKKLHKFLLDTFTATGTPMDDTTKYVIHLERPATHAIRSASGAESSARCWESLLIVMEGLGLEYTVVDSKSWQSKTLLAKVQGSKELKKESLRTGNIIFPSLMDIKHPDRDGILIALAAVLKK